MPATPGTSAQKTVNPGVGTAASVTWDPFYGIEVGRTISSTASVNQMGTITITGSATPVHTAKTLYTATTAGGVSNAQYEWSSNDTGVTIRALAGGKAEFSFSGAGAHTVTVKITDNNKSDSPKSQTLNITAS